MTGLERMNQYINDVKSRKVITNKWIKLAVKRFENDLEKSKDPNYPYEFKPELGEKFIKFAEMLKQVNDKWAGMPIVLMPFQCFIFMNIYSWVDKKTGNRRFRKAWLYMCRKSGKSTVVATSAIYDILSVNGSQVCLGATTRAQASLVFDVIRGMIEQNPMLSSRLKIYNSTLRVTNEKNYGKIEVLSADTKKTGDGKNCSLGIFDECSASDYGIYRIIESGQSSRPQPLNLLISSGSDDLQSMGKQEYDRACKILEGIIEDDSYFTVLYCLDDEDDWRDESKYEKANPALGITSSKEFLHKLKVQAEQTPSLLTEFKTKNLGIWCNSEKAWINHRYWVTCMDNAKKYSIDKTKPYYAVMGVDLSKKQDLTALSLVIYQDGRYFLKHKAYFPLDSLKERVTNESDLWYSWVEKGFVTGTPGKTISYDWLYKDIMEWSKEWEISSILYDPYCSCELTTELENSFEMIPIPQNLKNLSPFTKSFEEEVLKGSVVDDNPVMNWMISNATIYADANGNIKVVKNTNEKRGYNSMRIDNVICSLMGVGRIKNLLDNNELDLRTPEEVSNDTEKFLSSLKWE